MATDIMDPELKDQRNMRWSKAFNGIAKETKKSASDRKATIVIDHLIQASDVSHTSTCCLSNHPSPYSLHVFNTQCNTGTFIAR